MLIKSCATCKHYKSFSCVNIDKEFDENVCKNYRLWEQREDKRARTKKNKAYCLVSECPFANCEKHLKNCPTLKGKVHIIDFAATCRDYIGWLVDEIEKGR